MKEKEFHYQWWGKGDIDASLGIFFDGFSKVLTAVGILTAVFGMPMADVIGKVVPGIGISTAGRLKGERRTSRSGWIETCWRQRKTS